jgi:glycosyltransferase involved in cell wall biosynthesis
MEDPFARLRVAVLLSSYNGEAFLPEQLDSLLAQSHGRWMLFWRDDGSTDGSVALLEAFAAGPGAGRCVHVASPVGHLGPTVSFMTLLRAAVTQGDFDAVAFADQDDVWLPAKLSRGLIALQGTALPAIYCARQILVDAALRPTGVSGLLTRQPGFPASLTQNVATGCTVMLSATAARLVARSSPSPASLHDWWCYLLVTAAGGLFLHDDEPVVLYRQHTGNFVGAPPIQWRRAWSAVQRGPALFMSVLRQNVAALAAQPDLLSPQAHAEVLRLQKALQGGLLRRLGALGLPGLYRQTWTETLLFRVWFLIG